ncbi:SRPBCC family protein [Taibaiella koreensis]|uniref:SRPBCC family protein n=1 Tax=Taibaiella koreensis TaxID=1268548 RepID=UPI000E59AC21|nr:SRPBCC family protein [Taibaiella koreensis]
MKPYLLERETLIKAPLAEVWSFFSDPHNLSRLTPDYMRFRVIRCPDTNELYEGMLIEYRVRPLAGIPLQWITLIRKVQAGICFTDKQLKGPYRLWEHTHTFAAQGNHTLMKDSVRYVMPLGILGRLAHALGVKRQLAGIFDYREQAIRKQFPG